MLLYLERITSPSAVQTRGAVSVLLVVVAVLADLLLLTAAVLRQ